MGDLSEITCTNNEKESLLQSFYKTRDILFRYPKAKRISKEQKNISLITATKMVKFTLHTWTIRNNLLQGRDS